MFAMLMLSLVICRYRHYRVMLERERLLTRAQPYRLLLGDIQRPRSRREGKNLNFDRVGRVDQQREIVEEAPRQSVQIRGSESRLRSASEEDIVYVLEDLPPEYRTAC